MGKAKLVADGIWWVGCGSWGGETDPLSDATGGNVFLIGGDGDYALIDAAMPTGAQAVLTNASDVGAEPGSIHKIVLTHSHGDHVLAAPILKEKTGAVIAASALAAKALGGDTEARRHLFINHDSKFEVEQVLGDGDEITLGGYSFTVLTTPGHIPCSITLVGEVAGRKVAFTGDTAIGDQVKGKGIVGWLDGHWHSNPRHLLKSVERIMQYAPDLMLPGHGNPSDGHDAVAASLEHCADRLRQLLAIETLSTMMPLDMSD